MPVFGIDLFTFIEAHNQIPQSLSLTNVPLKTQTYTKTCVTFNNLIL